MPNSQAKKINNSKFTGALEPGCEEVTITEQLKKCKANPVGIQLSGPIMNRTGKNGCYSYAFNKSRSKQIPETSVIEPQLFTQSCDESCDTNVSIGCTFTDSNGEKRSCISSDREFTFLNMPRDECDGVSVVAEITMKQCNTGDDTLTLNADKSDQIFRGTSVANTSSLADLPSGECVTTVTNQIMDTCKSTFPMSINLKPLGKCNCYLFKVAKIDNYDGEIVNNPEIGTANGERDDAGPLVLIIAEITDPRSNYNRRFIELYSPNKRGYVITEDIFIVKYEGSSDVHSEVFESLKGKFIDQNGFLLLCNNPEKVDACTYQTETDDFLGDNTGRNDYAIAEVDEVNYFNSRIIDIYGKTGQGGFNSKQYFTGGRCFRKAFVNKANPVFTMAEWIVAPSRGDTHYTDEVGAGETSPGCWYGARNPETDCTNDLVGPPTVSPAPSSEDDANRYDRNPGLMTKSKGSKGTPAKSAKSTRKRSRL